MTLIKLVVAYDGTGFRGWARQPGLRTVEGVLEEALEQVLRRRPDLSVAGRTDAGVHARGQVVSLSTGGALDPGRVQRAVNGRLGPEVVVREARIAPEGFDARFSARAREYRYRIDTAPTPDPLAARFTWHRPGPLDLEAMGRAARDLVGEQDFASFCRAPKLPSSTVRTLHRLDVRASGRRLSVVARANGFLHQMVRSLVGTLVAVGEGRLLPEAMPEVLAARDRAAAGPVAPPHGLTLDRVLYRL
jgi:tRNA pseudouridine38-40 synthase